MRELLNGLPDDMVYKLILIMYLGRGYFGTNDLARELEQIRQRWADRESAMALIMENTPLDAQLLDGLAELNKSKINVDRLPARAARARKLG